MRDGAVGGHDFDVVKLRLRPDEDVLKKKNRICKFMKQVAVEKGRRENVIGKVGIAVIQV